MTKRVPSPYPRGTMKRSTTRLPRYAPAARLHQVRALLDSPNGVSIYDIAERFDLNTRTALRYLQALQRAGEPLYQETLGKRKVWRITPTARRQSITLSTSQMVALFLSRRVFDFLAGTGFKEDLDEVFEKLEAMLRRKDFLAVRNLDRKVFDVNEARHLYEGRLEDVNGIVTALLREDRLRVTHEGVSGGRKTFVLEPYSLLVYKKGLYLSGFSHHHQQIRTFALDGFRAVEWLRGDRFDYPTDYRPEQITEGAFGLIRGEPTRLRILFDAEVARYVQRRQWHPTQTFRSTAAGQLELTMLVSGTVEVKSWLLSFGDKAEVVEPAELRADVGAELRRAAARYERAGGS
jgi:predicted DNA-binding transcriptional regulator YafY